MENQRFWQTAVATKPNRTEPNQKLHQSDGFAAKKHLSGVDVSSSDIYIYIYK